MNGHMGGLAARRACVAAMVVLALALWRLDQRVAAVGWGSPWTMLAYYVAFLLMLAVAAVIMIGE